MKPLDAREWLESLRLEGCEFASELLELLDGQQEAEANADVIEEITKNVPDNIQNSSDRDKLVQWISDKLALLGELEKIIADECEDIDWPKRKKREDSADILSALFSSRHWLKYDL